MNLSPIGFPPATVYQITNVSQSFPGIVTVSAVTQSGAFYLIDGMTVTISNVQGMYQVNRQRYVIGSLNLDAMTFGIYTVQGFPVSTTHFNAYISGGEINIISYPPLAGQPPGLMYNTQPILT